MIKFNNKLLKFNNKLIGSLPPYTLRLRFTAGVTPTFSKGTGMYAMYQKLAALGNQIENHIDTFKLCGWETASGNAERALIPADWKGE